MTEPQNYFFNVEGMSCAHCLGQVKSLGINDFCARDVSVNLDKGTVNLRVAGPFDKDRFIASMKNLGFRARAAGQDAEINHGGGKQMLARIGVAGACAGNIMLIAFALYSGADISEFSTLLSWLSFALFLPVLVYSSYPILSRSFQSILSKKPSVDIPLALAIVGGTALSFLNLLKGSDQIYFDSLSIFVFLILSSRYLIFKLQQKHLRPISITNIFGKESVAVLEDGEPMEVPVRSLAVGDIFLVKSGECLPTDSLLDSAESIEVNTAVLTGESEPLVVHHGGRVPAGAKLYSASANFKATTSFENSGLSNMVERVNKAVHEKTELTSLTDRMATYFTGIILIAVGALIVSTFWLPLETVIDRILALLVLSCPCALAIATPLSLSLAIKKGFLSGLLIKKADVFERAENITHIGFDKTGTLTTGAAKVAQWLPAAPNQEQKNLIGSLEQQSRHPIALALLKSIGSFQPISISNLREVPGLGIEGTINGSLIALKKSEDKNKSEVVFSKNGEEILIAKIETEVRAEAPTELNTLKQNQLELFVLTGDGINAAKETAKTLDLPSQQVLANLSPEQKAHYLEEININHRAAYVGDGINDCLALAKSHLAFSMGGSPEATFRSSDVHLLKENLLGVNQLFQLSKRTLRLIKHNLILSLTYNLFFGGLAVAGLVNPFVAAVLMPISSLTVVGHTFLRMNPTQALGRKS